MEREDDDVQPRRKESCLATRQPIDPTRSHRIIPSNLCCCTDVLTFVHPERTPAANPAYWELILIEEDEEDDEGDEDDGCDGGVIEDI